MARANEFYRGRRKGLRPLTVCIIAAVVLILAAAFVFQYFERYLIYTPDGVSLEPPFLSREAAAPADGDGTPQSVDGTVVFDAPSFEDVQQRDVSGLTALHALYVPIGEVSDVGLTLAAGNLSSLGADALLLQMKAADGHLAWASAVPEAASYGASSTYDPTESLAALKERGIYLAAEVCCCTDALMAERNLPLALKNGDGAAYSDAAGIWLDPLNGTVRDYLAALCRELSEMGFDEIVLTGLAFPENAADVRFSQALSSTPDGTAAVSALAARLTAALADTDVRVSAECPASAILSGTPAASGQDPRLFFKLFDRVYAHTSGEAPQCLSAVAAYPITGEASVRFVFLSAYGLTGGSWVCTPES